MKTKLIAIAMTAIATIGLAATLAAAERTAGNGSEIAPILGGFDVIQPVATSYVDAGGMSASTGEQLTGASAYLVTHIEQPNGSVHPAFGRHPRGMLLSMTESGRYVVRFLELPPDASRIDHD